MGSLKGTDPWDDPDPLASSCLILFRTGGVLPVSSGSGVGSGLNGEGLGLNVVEVVLGGGGVGLLVSNRDVSIRPLLGVPGVDGAGGWWVDLS